MQRTGALFAVAQQAAAVEPLIAGFWQEGREQSRHAQEVFWTRLADDGLLPPGTDLAWLIDTATVSPRRRPICWSPACSAGTWTPIRPGLRRP